MIPVHWTIRRLRRLIRQPRISMRQITIRSLSCLILGLTGYTGYIKAGSIAVGTSIAGCPRTDPGGRDSRTGLPPRVVNDEFHEQLRVHSRASGTRLSGAITERCG